MADAYPIPNLAPGEEHSAEMIIKRSRFLATVSRVTTPDEAKAFVERLKARHPDANHNCWAFNAGAPGTTARIGASDDGEPKGTAGRPMLNVLLHCGIGEIAVVVTRYFGGIKLGAGGLVRAYSQGARDVIEKAGTAENVLSRVYGVKMPYDCYQPFLKFVDKIKKSVVSTDFSDSVTVKIAVPYDNADFAAKVTDLTNGKAEITEINSADEEYIVYDDDL